MSLLKGLFMALVLVLGGLYIYRFEQGPSERDRSAQKMPAAKPLFPKSELSTLKRVQVIAGANNFEIVRSGAAVASPWVLAEPKGAATDIERVAAIIAAISQLEIYNRIGKDELDPAESVYGFERPSMRLVLETEGGERTVFFGKRLDITGRRYAKLKGAEEIVLVGDEPFLALDRKSLDLRDRTPLTVEVDKVRQIQVTKNDTENFSFEKEKGGAWTFVGGDKKFEAERTLLKDILMRLTELEVKSFKDNTEGKLAQFGLEKPLLRIKLQTKEKDETLLVGMADTFEASEDSKEAPRRKTNYYLKADSEPQVYEISRGAIADLLKAADGFRDLRPFATLSQDSIQKIELLSKLSGQEKSLALEQKDGKWFHGATESRLSEKAMRNFLKSFSEFKVISYFERDSDAPNSHGLTAPTVQVKISLSSNTQIEIAAGDHVGGDIMQDNNSAPRHGKVELLSGEHLGVIIGAADLKDLTSAIRPLLSESK